MKKKTILGLSLAVLLSLGLAGCSKQSNAETTKDSGKVITVGTGNAYRPFVYLDENNELQGYDVEVLKTIDKKLPEYQFKYESMDFKNILTALGAGKVDFAGHQYEYNDERAKKYLYGKVGYTDYTLYVAANKDASEYTNLDTLAGKKVFTSPGSNAAYLLEQYNQKHENKIDIVYNEATQEVLVKGLQNGTADAALLTKYDVDKLNKEFSADLVVNNQPINESKTYFVFQKGDQALADKVDKALQELIDEGTLSELSKKILGADYTK
ncbi:transporter substrate-binding domain-containing protein [Enterococcus bulliens]